MTELQRLRNLEVPTGNIDCVLDTDTYNEIDDQYALSLMIKSPKLNLRAIYAAPFFNTHSTSPEDGMERSYDEILKLLTLMGKEDRKADVFKGSRTYLPDEKTPVGSPAARHLCELAMTYSVEKPLYVVAIGAITNVASALLLEPRIADRIVLVWLGGHFDTWPDTREFNLFQDVAGARVVFGCGCPLVQLPLHGGCVLLLRNGSRTAHLAFRQKRPLRLSCQPHGRGGRILCGGAGLEPRDLGCDGSRVAAERRRAVHALPADPCACSGV